MSLISFFGCLFLAYGPLISILLLYIARDAQHVLLMVMSVTIQEVFRWGFFRLQSLSGFGYALTTSLVSYIPLLVETLSPGVKMCPSCPKMTLFFISAITTTLFSLLHMLWMIIALDGYANLSTRTGILHVAWVIASHYGASYATLFNGSSIQYGCVYAAVICVCILSISVALSIRGIKIRHTALSKIH
ncbi:Aph-1 protein-domain-containing protein [Spinellus fusiger]|nr:Aph-1 protein-domain-containing protein [Spinellus fusiger]